MTFSFCYEFLLELWEEQKTFWTYKANIIYIVNDYNKLSSLFINKDISIIFILLLLLTCYNLLLR